MPVASAFAPIAPPRASISRTMCPLARPPIAGLHDIWPMVSRFCVNIRVRQPSRAAARAASTPAWPLPTTRTSIGSVSVNIFKNPALRVRKKMGKILNLLASPDRRANDNQLRRKFSQELPAGTARHDRFTCIGNHSDRDEFPLPRRDRTADRDSLGTNGQTVRDIFDIAADENSARFALNSRSYSKSRIWHIGSLTHCGGGSN